MELLQVNGWGVCILCGVYASCTIFFPFLYILYLLYLFILTFFKMATGYSYAVLVVSTRRLCV